MIRLAGVSSFQWSAAEQEYPFEKALDGSTLYAKEFSFVWDGNWCSIAHGLVNAAKLHRVFGDLVSIGSENISGAAYPAGTYHVLPRPDGDNTNYSTSVWVDDTNLHIRSPGGHSTTFNARLFLLYKK